MKCTRWALGLLSVAGLFFSVNHGVDAGILHHCGCHHHCCDMKICCRQYNAFTPVCFGSMFCDGCCPNFGCAQPQPCGPVCGAWGCGDFAGGMSPAGIPGLPPGAIPVGAPVPQGAPLPTGPVTPPVINNTAQFGGPMYYGVQPAGFYPGYGYQYNPYGYQPMAYPNYGYGYGYGQRPY
jgi:hypothetical protein